jgi:hypothetical protein
LGWSRATGYGRRWAAGIVFSKFKRLYREYCMARSMESIARR